jgi:hypothetical protein
MRRGNGHSLREVRRAAAAIPDTARCATDLDPGIALGVLLDLLRGGMGLFVPPGSGWMPPDDLDLPMNLEQMHGPSMPTVALAYINLLAPDASEDDRAERLAVAARALGVEPLPHWADPDHLISASERLMLAVEHLWVRVSVALAGGGDPDTLDLLDLLAGVLLEVGGSTAEGTGSASGSGPPDPPPPRHVSDVRHTFAAPRPGPAPAAVAA